MATTENIESIMPPIGSPVGWQQTGKTTVLPGTMTDHRDGLTVEITLADGRVVIATPREVVFAFEAFAETEFEAGS